MVVFLLSYCFFFGTVDSNFITFTILWMCLICFSGHYHAVYPWESKTKQRMVIRMIHVKDSLPIGKVWSLDFLGMKKPFKHGVMFGTVRRNVFDIGVELEGSRDKFCVTCSTICFSVSFIKLIFSNQSSEDFWGRIFVAGTIHIFLPVGAIPPLTRNLEYTAKHHPCQIIPTMIPMLTVGTTKVFFSLY